MRHFILLKYALEVAYEKNLKISSCKSQFEHNKEKGKYQINSISQSYSKECYANQSVNQIRVKVSFQPMDVSVNTVIEL